MKKQLLLLSFIIFGCQSLEQYDPEISKKALNLSSKALFQAISIVDEDAAWISGHQATFAQTLDGGQSWKVFRHESDTLQFRDVHAFDKSNIVLMSAGTGISSRIYLFNADEESYQETYVMPHVEGFLNTIEFWDDQLGMAFGDSFNGELFALTTADGGKNWERIDPAKMPKAGLGEGGFAASGTCISLQLDGKAWIATGAGGNSRILFTADYGNSWEAYDNPIIKGDAAGVTSINMLNAQVGVIVGGDLAIPDEYTDNAAITQDGGKTWKLTNKPKTKGAFYGSTIATINNSKIIFASGPKGLDYSFDMGQSWNILDTANYWAVKIHANGFGYAVGKDGKVLKLEID